ERREEIEALRRPGDPGQRGGQHVVEENVPRERDGDEKLGQQLRVPNVAWFLHLVAVAHVGFLPTVKRGSLNRKPAASAVIQNSTTIHNVKIRRVDAERSLAC